MDDSGLGTMAFSIHLFRLAKLNSEIKYVANSVVRQTPVYAYPSVVDIYEWQVGMLAQLDGWDRCIPDGPARMQTLCRVQSHTLRMVLLRPSPAIPKPTVAALEECHESARTTLRLFDELYKSRGLVHSSLTFYGIVSATLTMLYCVKMVPSVRERIDVTQLTEDMAVSSSLLSATGEHWSAARRCRDILDDLGRSVKELLPRGVLLDPPMEPSVFFDDFLGGGLFDENIDDIVRNMFPEFS